MGASALDRFHTLEPRVMPRACVFMLNLEGIHELVMLHECNAWATRSVLDVIAIAPGRWAVGEWVGPIHDGYRPHPDLGWFALKEVRESDALELAGV